MRKISLGAFSSPLESNFSVVSEKCVAEIVYLLQQFASGVTLQTPWRDAVINSFLCLGPSESGSQQSRDIDGRKLMFGGPLNDRVDPSFGISG